MIRLQVCDGVSGMRSGADDGGAGGLQPALQLLREDQSGKLRLCVGLKHRLIDAFALQIIEFDLALVAGRA